MHVPCARTLRKSDCTTAGNTLTLPSAQSRAKTEINMNMNIAKVTAALNHFIQIADSTSSLFNATANLADFGDDSEAATFLRTSYDFNANELNLFRELILKIVDVATVTPPEPMFVGLNTAAVAGAFSEIIVNNHTGAFRSIVDQVNGEFDQSVLDIIGPLTRNEQTALRVLCDAMDEIADIS